MCFRKVARDSFRRRFIATRVDEPLEQSNFGRKVTTLAVDHAELNGRPLCRHEVTHLSLGLSGIHALLEQGGELIRPRFTVAT